MHLDPASSNAPELAQGPLYKPLDPGGLGVLLAGAGVGKTACLTQIALYHLLRGLPVLHVCVDEVPEKIKVWYQEFIRNMASSRPGDDPASLQRRIEPMRFILAYLHHTFSPEKLERSFNNLKEQAKFFPAMVVLDGLDFDQVSRKTIEALRGFAENHGVSLWMSARTHRHIPIINERGVPYPCHELDDLFQAIVLLKTIPNAIQVSVLKHGDRYRPDYPDVLFNPQTFLALKGAAAPSG